MKREIDKIELTHTEGKVTVNLTIRLEMVKVPERTIDLLNINEYETCVILCTILVNDRPIEHGDGCLKTITDSDLLASAEMGALAETLKYWHCNHLRRGTRKQLRALDGTPLPSNASYAQVCSYLRTKRAFRDRGYEYGTGFLVERLPPDVSKDIRTLAESLGGTITKEG